MPYYVIGDDKGFEESYTAEEIDNKDAVLLNDIVLANIKTNTVANDVKNLTTTVNGKQKAITSGTAAPSGGSNGDIYIQY